MCAVFSNKITKRIDNHFIDASCERKGVGGKQRYRDYVDVLCSSEGDWTRHHTHSFIQLWLARCSDKMEICAERESRILV